MRVAEERTKSRRCESYGVSEFGDQPEGTAAAALRVASFHSRLTSSDRRAGVRNHEMDQFPVFKIP